jgi:hypothetical protein
MTRSINRLSLAPALLLAVALPAPASAQDAIQIQPIFDMGVLTMNAAIDTVTLAEEKRSSTGRYAPGAGATIPPSEVGRVMGRGGVVPQRLAFAGPGGAPAAARASAPVSLAYRADPALRRASLDAFLARAAASNRAGVEDLRRQFGRHDYDAVWRQLTRGSGLSGSDAADAMAAYAMLGWMIANTSLEDADPAHVRGIRAQLAPALATDPRLAAPDTRAALGEELKILAVILHAGWQSAQREGQLARYADGVAEFFQGQGLDLRALSVGPSGFEPR